MSAFKILSAGANIVAVVTSLISGFFWLLSTQTEIPLLITKYNSWAAFFFSSYIVIISNCKSFTVKIKGLTIQILHNFRPMKLCNIFDFILNLRYILKNKSQKGYNHE